LAAPSRPVPSQSGAIYIHILGFANIEFEVDIEWNENNKVML